MKTLTVTILIAILFVPGIRRLLKSRNRKGDFTATWREDNLVDYEQEQNRKAMIY